MPPLKGIDRGINGKLLKSLEESGHGRRVAVVDASYNIPRWAEVAEYCGATSLQGLIGIMKLVPFEGPVTVMAPDDDDRDLGEGPFCDIAVTEIDNEFDYPEVYPVERLDTTVGEVTVPGFYTLANDESLDTLFVRTRDSMPYACATFIMGHAQDAS